MIGVAKTQADVERRNSEGFPVVEANVPDNRGNFHQAVDNSVNKSLPWIFTAGGVAFLALGLVIANMVQQPQITDAKIEARMAEVRRATEKEIAEARIAMAQQVAEAKATSLAGTQHARIALDKVELLQIQLGQKGLIKTEAH